MSRHEHYQSTKKPLATLTPVFLQTLVKFRLDPVRSSEFIQDVETIIQSEKLLSHLVEQAEKLIATLASHKTYNQLPYGDREIKAKIKLHLILESMLHYAHDCGGEGGKRYTAAAICVCCREDGDQTLGFLQDLAATWLSHLLFVCKWLYSVAKSVF